MLVVKDLSLVHDDIDQIYAEGFARQAQLERETTSEMEADEQLQRLRQGITSHHR